MNKLLIAAISIFLFPVLALAEITPNDVAEKMKAGDIPAAEMLTKQILKEHPNSAKAHYYMGQILATETKYKAAYSELNKAAELDKSLSFAATPDRFRQEMDKVKMNLGRAESPAISNVKDEGWGWFTWLLLFSIGGGAVWFFFIRKPEEAEELEGKKEEKTYKPNPAANHPAYASTASQSTAQATASPSYHQSNGASYQPPYAPPHVVNNYNSGNDGLVEGMILGSMLSGVHGTNGSNTTITTNNTIIEKDNTAPLVPDTNFDSGSDDSSSGNNFDAGSDSSSKTDFDSGSSDSFDSGSSFDSGGSSTDSGSSGGDW